MTITYLRLKQLHFYLQLLAIGILNAQTNQSSCTLTLNNCTLSAQKIQLNAKNGTFSLALVSNTGTAQTTPSLALEGSSLEVQGSNVGANIYQFQFDIAKIPFSKQNKQILILSVPDCAKSLSIAITQKNDSAITYNNKPPTDRQALQVNFKNCNFVVDANCYDSNKESTKVKFTNTPLITQLIIGGTTQTTIPIEDESSHVTEIVLPKKDFYEDGGPLFLQFKVKDCENEFAITLNSCEKKASTGNATTTTSLACNCVNKELFTTECNEKNSGNNFGEDPAFFEDDKVIYVYDYNYGANSSKAGKSKGFYKIEKNKKISEKIKSFEKKQKDLKYKLEMQELYKKQLRSDSTASPTANKFTRKLKRVYKTVTSSTNRLAKIDLQIKQISPILATRPLNLNKEVLEPDQNLLFKVVNINRHAYDISFTDSIVTFDSDPPPLLRQFLIGDTTGLLGNLISASTESFNGDTDGDTHNYQDDYPASELNCLNTSLNRLRSYILKAYDPCTKFDCCSPFFAEDYQCVAAQLQAVKAKIVATLPEFTVLRNSLLKAQDGLAIYNKAVKDSTKISLGIARLTKEESNKPSETRKKEIQDTLALEKKKLDKMAPYKQNPDSIKRVLKRIEVEMTPYLAANTLLDILPTEAEIQKMFFFLNSLTESSSYFSRDYINLRGNRLDLSLQIEKKKSVAKAFGADTLIDRINYLFEIPIICHPFLSFSSGTFISPGKNLLTKQYAWQEVPLNNSVTSTSSFVLVESSYSPPPIGFAAFGSFEEKWCRNFGGGISFGVGLTVETKPRTAYLFGGSLFFGNTRQFALTCGFTFMQVEKLQKEFETISNNAIVYSTNTVTPKYYKTLGAGSMFALSYTPFKTRKNSKKRN